MMTDPTPQPRPMPRAILCPFCGSVSQDMTRCTSCGGRFDPLSRQASQNAMGPWFIRDETSPHRPGCSYETLKGLVAKGKITPDTVLRGPTTRQFWELARRTPSIANLLGICHSCQQQVQVSDYACGSCGAVFSPETDRQHLGLSPVRLLPGQATPEQIARVSAAPQAPTPQRSVPDATEAPRGGGAPQRLRRWPFFALILVTVAVGGTAGWAVSYLASVGERVRPIAAASPGTPPPSVDPNGEREEKIPTDMSDISPGPETVDRVKPLDGGAGDRGENSGTLPGAVRTADSTGTGGSIGDADRDLLRRLRALP